MGLFGKIKKFFTADETPSEEKVSKEQVQQDHRSKEEKTTEKSLEQPTKKVEERKEKSKVEEKVDSKLEVKKVQISESTAPKLTEKKEEKPKQEIKKHEAKATTPLPEAKKEREDLDQGLKKTKEGFFSKLSRAVVGKSTVDADVLDNLEEMLIASDVGVQTTIKIIDAIEARVAKDKYVNTSELNAILRAEITGLMLGDKKTNEIENIVQGKVEGEPYVIMVVGVNGVGKTTTIGKLAHGFKSIGLNVTIGAADTFRAAAIDQIKVWGERTRVPVVAQKMGSDPASVAYDTLESAVSTKADVVLVDTAGRLHNKINLMNELSKIKNVMKKVVPGAPHEVLLVLDASTGQNAIEQAKQFTKATEVTALALTKLDGTAKGGVVIGISDQFQIPVKYIGVGEGIDHLQIFDKKAFVDSLFEGEA